MAFTRTPLTGTPATYNGTAAGEDLFLVDQAKDIRVNGDAGNDTIAISAAALAANALYNIESYGNDGDDTMFLSANLVSNSILQGGNGKDTIGAGSTEFTSSFIGSTVRGGADSDLIITGDVNNGTFNGNKGNDNIFVDGNASNAKVYGGSGLDTITLEATSFNNSTFNGSKGNDVINVQKGSFNGSTIYGGADNDIINVNQDAKDPVDGSNLVKETTSVSVSGDKGNDTLNIGNATVRALDKATVAGGEGNDTLTLVIEKSAEVDLGVGADDFFVGTSKAGAVSTYIFNAGDSVAATATTFAGAKLANGDKITFGSGVDFLSGLENKVDLIDGDFTDSAYGSLNGADLTTQILTNEIYQLRGTFAAGVFSVLDTGTDYLYVAGGTNQTLANTFTNNANILISDQAIAESQFV